MYVEYCIYDFIEDVDIVYENTPEIAKELKMAALRLLILINECDYGEKGK
jgi:hypothetical protein